MSKRRSTFPESRWKRDLCRCGLKELGHAKGDFLGVLEARSKDGGVPGAARGCTSCEKKIKALSRTGDAATTRSGQTYGLS